MGEIASLREAVTELVRASISVTLESVAHLILTAVAHELNRQGRRNLSLLQMTLGLPYDQMIGEQSAIYYGAPDANYDFALPRSLLADLSDLSSGVQYGEPG